MRITTSLLANRGYSSEDCVSVFARTPTIASLVLILVLHSGVARAQVPDCDDFSENFDGNSVFMPIEDGSVELFDGATCGPLYITPSGAFPTTGDVISFIV